MSTPDNPLFEQDDNSTFETEATEEFTIFGSTAEHDNAEAERDARNKALWCGL
eukprot:SAG31_NODE_33881_length_339_cov_0.650000_1_plen_52_part_10